jgi:hypothetical protein
MHQKSSYGRLSVPAIPVVLLVSASVSIVHEGVFAADNWTLSVSVDPVNSGSVNLNNTGPCSYGDVVQLTSVPTIGWSFDHARAP